MDSVLSILLALAVSIDNLGVGIAYGSRNIRVSHGANLIIAGISFSLTLVAAWIGLALNTYVSDQFCNAVGAIAIGGVGFWILAQPLVRAWKERQPLVDIKIFSTRIYVGPAEILQNPEKADLNLSQDIDRWEAVVLGFALSINALAGGLDAGLIELPPVLLALLVGLFSFSTVGAGVYVGKRYVAQHLGDRATLIAGIGMVVLALYQILRT